MLAEGRLAGWGRPSSSFNDAEPIRREHWDALTIADRRISVLSDPLSDIRMVDVRVFPILRAPDARSRLDGRNLVDVLADHVWMDPAVAACRERDLERNVSPGPLGITWAPFRSVRKVAVDPIDDPIGTLNPAPYPESDTVMASRFSSLFRLLASGAVVAHGFDGEGRPTEVGAAQWRRSDLYVEVAEGSLLEVVPGAKEPRHALRRISSGIRLAAVDRTAEAPMGRTVVRTRSMVSAETKCQEWLADLMRKLPEQSKPKAEWWDQATERFGSGLSRRGFDRAWANAVAETGAVAWSTAGRISATSKSNQRTN